MVDFSFIRLERSKERAFNTQESPFANKLYYGQVQLLPLDPKPYFQSTNLEEGVFLTDNVQAYLVDDFGNEEDITPHFSHHRLLGVDNQIIFRLADLPTDHGHRLVHLKITSDLGVTYYSNQFLVSNRDAEITSRLDYRRIGLSPSTSPLALQFDNVLHSIRLQFFFDIHIDQEVSENYFQITRGQNVNSRFDFADLKQWRAIGIDSFTWKRLKRAFYSGTCYIDFIRNYPTDAFEFTGRIERSNISEQTFVTDPYENDVHVVNDVFVVTTPNLINTWDSTTDTFDSTEITFDNQ